MKLYELTRIYKKGSEKLNRIPLDFTLMIKYVVR